MSPREHLEPFVDQRIWVDILVNRPEAPVTLTVPLKAAPMVMGTKGLEGIEMWIRRLPSDPAKLTPEQIGRKDEWRKIETIGEEDLWAKALASSQEIEEPRP